VPRSAARAAAALATGDFSATGETDVLLRDADGAYAIAATGGTHLIATTTIGTPAGFESRAFGDLNGNGKADLLFEDAAGHYAAWLMNDTAIIGGGTFTTLASSLHVV
jgi:hypothetical protein